MMCMPIFVKCSSVPTALRHAQSYDRDQNCDQLRLWLEKKRVFAVSKNFRARGKAANCAVECMVCLQAIVRMILSTDVSNHLTELTIFKTKMTGKDFPSSRQEDKQASSV